VDDIPSPDDSLSNTPTTVSESGEEIVGGELDTFTLQALIRSSGSCLAYEGVDIADEEYVGSVPSLCDEFSIRLESELWLNEDNRHVDMTDKDQRRALCNTAL
jgi:hypothetical protein